MYNIIFQNRTNAQTRFIEQHIVAVVNNTAVRSDDVNRILHGNVI